MQQQQSIGSFATVVVGQVALLAFELSFSVPNELIKVSILAQTHITLKQIAKTRNGVEKWLSLYPEGSSNRFAKLIVF